MLARVPRLWRAAVRSWLDRHGALAREARSDLRAVLELVATVSVYGVAVLVGAIWLGVAVRVAVAASGFR